MNNEYSHPLKYLSYEDVEGVVLRIHPQQIAGTTTIGCARNCEDDTFYSIFASLTSDNPRFQGIRGFSDQESFSAEVEIPLESDIEGSILCLYQYQTWWLRPMWINTFSAVPARSQILIWKSSGLWHAVMAYCPDRYRVDFESKAGVLNLIISTNALGSTEVGSKASAAFGYAEDNDINKCIQRLVRHGAHEAGIEAIEEKRYPSQLEGLGWCTWDSLGKEVNEAQIIAKMDEFSEKGVLPSWVLIDDGWSSTNREKETLHDFCADEKRFPKGLAHTVTLLKERYGIQFVGVWQCFQGYWNGIEPESPVAIAAAKFLDKLNDGTLVPSKEPERSFGFWNMWHSQLRKSGIDFVKVDSQSSASVFTRGESFYGDTTKGPHVGLEASVFFNFDGGLINCMGMAPENYWHRVASSITRTSNDFLPHDAEWFSEHVKENTYISQIMKVLYFTDFDMFWTKHPNASAHALLRVMSSGPVYISDAKGETNPNILKPLIFSDGSLPRLEQAVSVAEENIIADPSLSGKALMIYGKFRSQWVLAAFGISKKPVNSSFSLSNLRETDEDFWCYSAATQKAILLHESSKLEIPALTYGSASLYFILPASLALEQSGVLPIGLTEKYIAGAGISRVETNRNGIIAELLEPGVFSFLDPQNFVQRVETEDSTPLKLISKGVVKSVKTPSKLIYLLSSQS